MPDPAAWKLADVRAARDRIAGEVPDAVFEESDYGFSLAVTRPGTAYAHWVARVGSNINPATAPTEAGVCQIIGNLKEAEHGTPRS